MRELADAFQWELEHDATAVWPHMCGSSRLRDLNVREGFIFLRKKMPLIRLKVEIGIVLKVAFHSGEPGEPVSPLSDSAFS